MDKGENYEVKDIKLAEQGRKNIEWAEMQMGALMKIKNRYQKEKPLNGKTFLEYRNLYKRRIKKK